MPSSADKVAAVNKHGTEGPERKRADGWMDGWVGWAGRLRARVVSLLRPRTIYGSSMAGEGSALADAYVLTMMIELSRLVVVHVEFVVREESHCLYKLLLRDCVIDLLRYETTTYAESRARRGVDLLVWFL
jgi:hypothetical protein